jgi:hypothetical protein
LTVWIRRSSSYIPLLATLSSAELGFKRSSGRLKMNSNIGLIFLIALVSTRVCCCGSLPESGGKFEGKASEKYV